MRNDVLVLARRQSLFERLTIERNVTPMGTSKRSRLEAARERCAQKLAACSSEVLRANAERRIGNTTDLSELGDALETAESLKKWRSRLTRELVSLRAAAERLSTASVALTLANAKMNSDMLLAKTRDGSAAREHCTSASDALDAARSTPFVRRTLPAAISLRLRIREATRATVVAAQADVQQAIGLLSEVISKCLDELVALIVAHAQLDAAIMHASDKHSAQEAGRCDSMLQIPTLKRALCLLITLT